MRITAYGHPNILAMHRTTWQITREDEISLRADCIIGVSASESCSTLSPDIRFAIQEGRRIRITLSAGGVSYFGTAEGHPDLLLADSKDMVFRKSDFISDRTAAIRCSFAAVELPDTMKSALKDPSTILEITLEVDDEGA